MRENTSAPITSALRGARRCGSSRRRPSARRRSREHTACTSKAAQPCDAELVLHDAGRRREHHVRRRGGDDDQVDRLRRRSRRPRARAAPRRTPRSLQVDVGRRRSGARGCRCARRSTRRRSRCRRAASCAARSSLVTPARRQEAAGAGDARIAGGRWRSCGWRRVSGGRRRSVAALGGRAASPASVVEDAGRCDAVEQAVARGIISAVQRLLEGEGVGRAVALEHQAAQAEQRRAVVAAVVDPVLEAR